EHLDEGEDSVGTHVEIDHTAPTMLDMWVEVTATVVNVDKLTYAGNLESLAGLADESRHVLEQVDIRDAGGIARVFERHKPRAVMHLAAESHVDRSIDGPAAFIETNIVGTSTLLEAARGYWEGLEGEARQTFRFHHVSTDEVYGSLGDTGLFTEQTPYSPNSPYSASKAALINLTQTTACDLGGAGIRVNAVCPGLIETGMTQPVFDYAREAGKADRLGARCELRRYGHPHEVASVVAFLASDDASYITGQALAVDGGNTASLNLPGMKF
ncbi:hypothetical protein LCGC14_1943080, partial [marine sediment metagenome]